MISDIEAKSILVIGDVMLDTYLFGDVNRISPEAPVPVFHKKKEKSVLGGAANVASNLITAGQRVSLLTIVGNDDAGKYITSYFQQKGIDTEFVFTLNRNTTVKTRFMANQHQQVMRLDVEDVEMLEESAYQEILDKLKDKIAQYDLVILSDYLKGLLSFSFTQNILQLVKEKNIKSLVDVKDARAEKYKDAFLLKPNTKELSNMTGMPARTDEEIIKASQYLKKVCECKYVLTTCGARGMVMIGDGEPYFIETTGKEVYDVTGAGDTVIAYLAACMVNHMPLKEAVNIANYAAGIQVSKVGTSEVSWQEVKEVISQQIQGNKYKLVNDRSAAELREKHKHKKIVFTNGCFDILHIGHIRYLQETAKLGDLLVVGLNSDQSVKRLKGEERPINNEQDRAEVLCALEFVDYVVIFEEDTPYDLISKIQPDVLTKGGDYKEEEIVGADIVKQRGGKVVLVPFVEGKSTTNIFRKIADHKESK